MGEYYKVTAYLPNGSNDAKNAIVSFGIRTCLVTEHGRVPHRMSDIVRGRLTTDSPVTLEIIVETEELARRVMDLIKLNATAGNPNERISVDYTKIDGFTPTMLAIEQYPI